jgi:hypothetical protein
MKSKVSGESHIRNIRLHKRFDSYLRAKTAKSSPRLDTLGTIAWQLAFMHRAISETTIS